MGVTLELLKFFKVIDYPITFSTKSVWWAFDKRYADIIRNMKNWHFKVSIITNDKEKAKIIERGVPSPQDRLELIKELKRLNVGSVVLRLRPFIPYFSDYSYMELIEKAKKAGADAVSTEYLCLDQRLNNAAKVRFREIDRACNINLFEYYRQNSTLKSGYLRLSKEIKKDVFSNMKKLCDKLGMRFYVSDAHWKELSSNGSCCGLPSNENYCKGQFTEALIKAKEKGQVKFSDISDEMKSIGLDKVLLQSNINLGGVKNYRKRKYQTIYEWIREMWNTPNWAKSPYHYFNGALMPEKLDKNNDIIYKYNSK